MNNETQTSRFRLGKKVASVFLSAAILTTTFTGLGSVLATSGTLPVAAADYGLATKIEDGNILHCFDWKLSDIKQALPEIAEAGFTSVQTSPIQGHNNTGTWFWLYQPTNFNIGNELGSYQDLKDLCAEADKYGIKVIVDVVANHLAGWNSGQRADAVDSSLNRDDYFHNQGAASNWNDRNEIIFKNIGMPDLASENESLQGVIFGMINSMKDAGVDGIRWDAAKHIGLPSEGCSFWKNVAALGMYNYGEILDGPAGGDTGSDYNASLMKEYGTYIGVTDSIYCGTITGSIRDGSVSQSTGHWGTKGVASNRLVYWAESHDTYSNNPPPDEGGWTKYLSEDVMDRAYAVVAARAGSQALYLSRPFEKEKTSINYGVKGSTHYTEKQVAEVNKFHNAMVGTKEYLTTGENCYVICRGGGAVVVNAGGGSKTVTVPNGGGLVPAGTYTDKVSGSTWTVTDSTMSGSIGDKGIAVFYNGGVTPTPAGSVSASPSSGSFTDSITVTLSANGVTNAKYTSSDGQSGSFTDGQKITLGASAAVGSTVTLSLSGTKADGSTATASCSYTKKDPTATVSVNVDNSVGNWSKVYAYVYKGAGGTGNELAGWPGKEMTKSGDYYTLDVTGYENGYAIFSDGTNSASNRYPADKQPGLSIGGSSKLFTMPNKWEDLPTPVPVPVPTPDVPTVTADKASGTSFNTETLKIKLSLENATEGTYSVDGGPTKKFSSATTVEIGEGKIGDSTVTVETTATGSDGTKKSYTFTYEKKYVVKTSSSSAGLSSYYSTNGKGVGKEKTITIDGDASDWSEDMMIAKGAAWDVANHWKGAHENCLLDTYALFAAWDDTNLYIGVQMVNTTDTWQNPGDASLMDGAGVGNVPMILALSIDPSSPTMTCKETTTGKPIWSMGGLAFETHVDRLFYMSGQPGQGEPSMFAAADSQGNTDYTDPKATIGFAKGGIEYKVARTNICSDIYGLNDSQDPADVGSDSADWVDYKTYTGSKGVHDTSIDTFFEIKIPLATLGIDKNYLTSNGIGAMWLATRGESPLDCIPFDPSMVDNVKGDYSADPSTSKEKEDLDTITVPLASIGNGTINPTPTPTPTPTPGTPLQVNFGTDKSAPQLNDTSLTIKAIGMGGTEPYKYEFSVDGTVVKASNATATYSWKPGTSKQHTLKCVITDSTGAKETVTKTFTSEGEEVPTPVPTPSTLSNTSKISATTITKGQSLTVTGSCTGGEGTKQYAVWYKKSTQSDWTQVRTYGTGTSITVTPKNTGTYYVVIKVKDGAGTVVRKQFDVTVKEASTELANTSTISSTTITKGQSVTVTGKSSGGTGTKQYAVWYKNSTDSDWTQVRSYATGTSITVTPKRTGTYYVVIKVKDGAGTVVRKQFTVKVNEATAALANTSTISSTSITKGQSVTVTGKSSGGTGTKQYAVWYKNSTDSDWTQVRTYATGTSITVTPKRTGTYYVVIKVKDGAGTVVRKQFNVTVKEATAALANTSKISATSITLGNAVTVTASSTGGTGTKKYAVYYKRSTDSAWTTGQTYGTTTSIKVTPKHTGTYTVRVKVKDSSGKEVNKDFTVKVTASTLANTTKVSATTIAKGGSVKVTASSTGGVGTKQYAVWYKKSTQSSWTQAKKYSTGTTATVTPKNTGTYYISVKVKDGAGTIVKKQFTIKVNAALANTTKVSATTIAKGGSVKVTASSTGGVGTKQYAVWYKKSTQDSYTQVKSYSTGTTATVTPKNTGTYYISVKVKDGAGTIVKKQFTIKVNAALANTTKVSSTWIYKGSSIKVTGASTGGVGTKQYAVWYKKSTQDSYTQVKSYSTGTTATVTPKGTGTYYISVKVKDGAGSIVKKAFTIKVYTPLANTSTISATSITKGKSLTLTCASTGGVSTKTYAVWYKPTDSSTWTKVRDYATGTKVTVTPKNVKKYTVRVKAKDTKGTIVNKDFTVTVKSAALTNSSKLSATTIDLGSSVTVTCASSGGTGTKQYAVWYKQTSQDTWTKGRDYGTGTSVTITPKAATTYTVRVKAKDGSGTIVNKDLSLTVVKALTAKVTASATTVNLGTSITITGSAVNATGTVQYEISYLKIGTSTWTTIKSYNTTPKVTCKLPSTGNYSVKVKAKDSTGKVSEAFVAITVK